MKEMYRNRRAIEDIGRLVHSWKAEGITKAGNVNWRDYWEQRKPLLEGACHGSSRILYSFIKQSQRWNKTDSRDWRAEELIWTMVLGKMV
jgi:hypothetical protein